MTMVDRKCRCGVTFKARAADIRRGWGKFCSKRCKAVEQERRTGQHTAFIHGQSQHTRRDGAVFDRRGDMVGWVGVFDSDGNSQ